MSHPGIDAIRILLADRSTKVETIEERRASLEALAGAVPSPPGVEVEPLTLAGRPAERSTPERVDGPGVVLYLHGGAYVSGSLSTHRALTGRIALAAARPVVSLDYRLAPEHPFPAAVDDAVAAAVELAEDGTPLAVAGDSAGGGLALATLVALRDSGVGVRPVAGWLISPWADLTQSGATYDSRVDTDPMLRREGLADAADDYLAGADPTSPLASPMLADLTDLPPLRIDVGDAEVLLDDAVVTGHRVEEAGGAAQVVVWPEMIHVFPAFPADVVPEADECLTAAGAFLAQHLTA
jgi:acetyl esterase/lipase